MYERSEDLENAIHSVKNLYADFLDGSAGDGISTFAVNKNSGTFEQYEYKGTVLTGERISDHGLSASVLQSGFEGSAEIDGESFYISAVEYESEEYGTLILVYAEQTDMLFKNTAAQRWCMVLVILLIAMMLTGIYGILLRRYYCHTDGKMINRQILGRLVVFSGFLLVIAAGATWLIHSLFGVSEGLQYTSSNEKNLSNYYAREYSMTADRSEYDERQAVASGRVAAIIGFGSQQLVSDFVSGIFIVFENDVKVGDYVSVDGFSGIVKSIGQRNTRILNVEGNIMTISNSKISKIINLSEEMTSVYIQLDISIDMNLHSLEEIMENGLKEKLANCTDIFIEMPYFVGITEVSASSYKIAVSGKCLHRRKLAAEREINRAILEIIKDNPEIM